MGKKAKKQASTMVVVTPRALTAKVLCDKGHALTGLFVVFKLVPAADAKTKADKVAHVIESGEDKPDDPGPAPPEPVEPDKPTEPKKPSPAPKAKKGGTADDKAAYDKAKADFDALMTQYKADHDQWTKDNAKYQSDLKKYKTDHEKWKKTDKPAWDKDRGEYDQWTSDAPKDPADQFVVGFVDDNGFLQPVHADSDPWFEIGVLTKGKKKNEMLMVDRRDPHTYKLLVGEKYQACLVRHPSAALARALAVYLNSAGGKDDAKWQFASWEPKWQSLLREVTVDKTKVDSGDQAVIKLKEGADDYYPKGADAYGKWTLYRDMPHQSCEGVLGNAQKLATDMGKLRYPVGGVGSPYAARDSGYDGQVQAAVARFHEHVGAARAFKVASKALAHDKGNDWAYLIGAKADAGEVGKLHAAATKGVVDKETAALVAAWTKAGLRKPGQVLLKLATSGEWMLERGTVAVDAWSLLAKAFGCSYGVKPGSTMRSVLVGAWPGAVMNSIHKTGLAIDFSGGGTRHASTAWPIRYEAHWRWDVDSLAAAQGRRDDAQHAIDRRKQLEASKAPLAASLLTKTPSAVDLAAQLVQAEAALQAAKDKHDADAKAIKDAGKDKTKDARPYTTVAEDQALGRLILWKQRWRLYGHSTLDVFGGLDVAMEQLANNLGTYVNAPDPSKPTVPDTADDADADDDAVEVRAVKTGSLVHLLQTRFPDGLPGAAVTDWINAATKRAIDSATAMLARVGKHPDDDAVTVFGRRLDFVDDYFRDEVVQFTPNFYEADGGTAGKRYKPADGDADFPAVAGAKAWVNLSALGYACGMERIGPHSSDIRDQTWLWGDKLKDDKRPRPFAMSGFLALNDAKQLIPGDVAIMLKDISAGSAEAPNLKRGSDDVPVLTPTGDKDDPWDVVKTYKPKDIDGTFVKAWADALCKFPPGRKDKLPKDLVSLPGGAQVGLVYSATETGLKVVNPIVEKLKGSDFADKRFVVVEAGDKAKLDVVPLTITKGKDLADEIKKSLDKFKDASTAFAKKNADDSAPPPDQPADPNAPKPSKAQQQQAEKARKKALEDARKKAADAAAAQTKRDRSDWRIVIQPVFGDPVANPDPKADPKAPLDLARLTFMPTQSVKLPFSGAASHLEWWHYQHATVRTAEEDREASWGGLLKECGYSVDVMKTPFGGHKDGKPVHRGLGYSDDDVKGTPWGADEGPVENRDVSTPAGG